MNEITTLTVNGVTYTLRDGAAQTALEGIDTILDAILGEETQ